MVKVTRKIKIRLARRFFWPLLLLLFQQVNAEGLEVKWYGTTCMTISDGKEIVLLDPYFTRPGLWDLLVNTTATSDEKLVKKMLAGDFERLSGILISHTHFDHIVDLKTVVNKRNIPVYGPKNTVAIAKAMGIIETRPNVFKNGESFNLGAFKITPFKIEHSPLPIGIMYARGEMTNEAKTELGWNDFKSMQGYSFYIEHAEGTILFHPTAEGRTYPEIKKVDGLIVGLTGRDLTELKEKVLNPIEAKVVIPVHHDLLIAPVDGQIQKMPFYPTLGEFPKGTFPISYKIKK